MMVRRAPLEPFARHLEDYGACLLLLESMHEGSRDGAIMVLLLLTHCDIIDPTMPVPIIDCIWQGWCVACSPGDYDFVRNNAEVR